VDYIITMSGSRREVRVREMSGGTGVISSAMEFSGGTVVAYNAGTLISFGSDAHAPYQLSFLDYSIAVSGVAVSWALQATGSNGIAAVR
jgi:hypothetical protein